MSLFVARELGGLPGPVNHSPHAGRDVVITGHSVGELTAAALAGVLTVEEAIALTAARGRAMAAACAQTPTGMSAVLGGDPDEVLAAIAEHGLTPANMNGAGQVVAAGTLEQLEALRADPPARARVIPLQVAGAFHTHHMQSAVDRLARYARAISTHDPRLPLVSNADGTVVQDGREVLARLVSQVSSPVRWDLTMETFADMGVTGLIEVPPAGTLAGLAKRALKGVETLALKSPDDLEAAHRMIREHGAATELAPIEASWMVVVSPVKGTVQPTAPVGETVAPGRPVATVTTLRDAHAVVSPHGGRAVEWLVEAGDPVSPGQPLLRLYPEEDSL
jgi:[acyl-carrier-protein] S-malonyltransferase